VCGIGSGFHWVIRKCGRKGFPFGFSLKIPGRRSLSLFQKLGEGVVVLAIIDDFEAMLLDEGAGVVGQAAEGGCGEDGSGSGFRVGAEAVHLGLKGCGLGCPYARQQQLGEGHGLDQGSFAGVGGLKLASE
jgi:hypothetical protein